MVRSASGTKGISTEMPNARTRDLSSMSTEEIMRAINEEDFTVPSAVREALPDVCRAAEAVSAAVNSGNRIFLLGAGTSGKIAALDAAELPPTFGFPRSQFKAIMAGGTKAYLRAVEGAEDSTSDAPERLKRARLSSGDAVIGITASGRTPFVIAGLKYAQTKGSRTICITSNKGSEITRVADITIVVETGAEVITGSTRMKAGTAQKLVLNMISTFAGIRAGRVIGNNMVGMKPSNKKLRLRAVDIVVNVAKCGRAEATRRLEDCDYDIAAAIAAIGLGRNKGRSNRK